VGHRRPGCHGGDRPYWKNLFAALVAAGFAVALLNPLRTRRFAGEDLRRTQTDAIDAVGIAQFAAQKRPPASRLPDGAIEELRELVRFRDRLRQDIGDRVRQLHQLVDLGGPECTRHVRDLGSELATALLRESPTAAGFHGVPVRRVALGSCWGLAVFAAMLPFLLWRLLAEERILARDFTGIRRIPAARPVPSRAVHLVTFVRTVDFCPGRSTYW
jgi:hypothetical protein